MTSLGADFTHERTLNQAIINNHEDSHASFIRQTEGDYRLDLVIQEKRNQIKQATYAKLVKTSSKSIPSTADDSKCLRMCDEFRRLNPNSGILDALTYKSSAAKTGPETLLDGPDSIHPEGYMTEDDGSVRQRNYHQDVSHEERSEHTNATSQCETFYDDSSIYIKTKNKIQQGGATKSNATNHKTTNGSSKKTTGKKTQKGTTKTPETSEIIDNDQDGSLHDSFNKGKVVENAYNTSATSLCPTFFEDDDVSISMEESLPSLGAFKSLKSIDGKYICQQHLDSSKNTSRYNNTTSSPNSDTKDSVVDVPVTKEEGGLNLQPEQTAMPQAHQNDDAVKQNCGTVEGNDTDDEYEAGGGYRGTFMDVKAQERAISRRRNKTLGDSSHCTGSKVRSVREMFEGNASGTSLTWEKGGISSAPELGYTDDFGGSYSSFKSQPCVATGETSFSSLSPSRQGKAKVFILHGTNGCKGISVGVKTQQKPNTGQKQNASIWKPASMEAGGKCGVDLTTTATNAKDSVETLKDGNVENAKTSEEGDLARSFASVHTDSDGRKEEKLGGTHLSDDEYGNTGYRGCLLDFEVQQRAITRQRYKKKDQPSESQRRLQERLAVFQNRD